MLFPNDIPVLSDAALYLFPSTAHITVPILLTSLCVLLPLALYSFRCCCFQKRPPRLAPQGSPLMHSKSLRGRSASMVGLDQLPHAAESAFMRRIPTILSITDEFAKKSAVQRVPGRGLIDALSDRLRFMRVTSRTHFGGGLESIYTDLNNMDIPVSPSASDDGLESPQDEVLEALRQLEIFSWLPCKALRFLVRKAEVKTYEPGEELFQAGVETYCNFVLLSGECMVRPSVDVSESPVKPMATAVAASKVRVAQIGYAQLVHFFDAHAGVREQFLKRALLLLHRVVFTTCYHLSGRYFQSDAAVDGDAAKPGNDAELDPVQALSGELGLSVEDLLLFTSECPNAFRVVTLEPGALTCEVIPGSHLLVVLSGRLEVRSPGVDDDAQTVHYVALPGQGVGHLSVLTRTFHEWYVGKSEGQLHPAHTVLAPVAARVVAVSELDYHRLVDMYPEVVVAKARQVVIGLAPVVRLLDCATRWILLQPGDVVSKEGEPVEGLHVVLQGRVRATRNQKLLGEYGRGSVLGEFSFLTNQNSLATMRALRRSSLAFVPRTMMRVVTKLHPEAYAFIGRTVTRKMQAMFQHDAGGGSEGGSGPRKRSVAVIAASPNVALDAFCLTLKQALQSIGVSALVCSSLEVNAASTGLSRTGVPELLEEALALSKLNDLEDQHDVVLFKADPDASIWSRMCVAQADVVLFVCNGADRPMMSVLEMELRSSNPGVRRELVLLHVVAHHPSATGEAGGANAAAPGHTREWIEIIGDIAMHHQVRYHPYDPSKDVAHFKSDFRRVGRFLTGQAVGVVLGGGGARGAAHLAVLRALEEAQVPVDAVGGTSIGAFMGCLYSLKGADTLDMHGPFYRFAQEMASLWLKVRDLTFPIVSYVKGTQFNRMLVRVFGEVLIEDLWLNFFCITTDLTDSKQVVHRNGYAWKYVRASMTLTGFLPPMCDVGPDSRIHYLVDGGYVNVLPTDVMRQVVGDHGLVISVDVQAEWSLDGEDYGDDLNGWWFLWRRLLGRAPRIPTGSDIQSHLAYVSSVIQFGRAANEIKVDLSVAPPIKAFGMMQFEKVKEMQQLGFEYAVVAVKEWLAKLKASDEKRVRSFGATGPASRRMAVPPSRFSSSAALSLSQSQSLEHIVDFSIVANSAEESVDDMGGGAGDGVE